MPGVRCQVVPDVFRILSIDRFEVTNRAFKQFVDAGGYRDRAHWEHPFVKDGRTLSLGRSDGRVS